MSKIIRATSSLFQRNASVLGYLLRKTFVHFSEKDTYILFVIIL